MNVLEVKDVHKSFGDKLVLDGVSFSVPENCVFGFIGKNGAGKTTTMKAILGLLEIDGGEIYVCDEKIKYGVAPKSGYIGYLPDVPEFYSYMNAREYLSLCGELTSIPKDKLKSRVDELLGLVGLGNEKHRIKGYSRGMKQRLGIASALIHNPKLLICDEPTSALDPVGRKEILDIIKAAREKTSVVFSTHILSDVERVCSKIAFIEGGKTVYTGTIEEIHALKKGSALNLVLPDSDDYTVILEAFSDCRVVDGKIVFDKASDETQVRLMGFLAERNMPVTCLERQEVSLEDLFLEVVSR